MGIGDLPVAQEFQLLSMPGNTSVSLSGDIDIQLPSYMTLLAREELLKLQNVKHPENHIIAAGYEAKSGDIVLLTADGSIREVRAEFKRFKNPVKCVPINYGRIVIFNDDITIASNVILDIAREATVKLAGGIKC